MQKNEIINFALSTGSYPAFINQIIQLATQKKSSIVCVANVHMFIEAYYNKYFLNIINHSDIVTPDGRPLIWALRLLKNIKQERVAGMDLLPDLLKEIELNNISVYFYGSTPEMLQLTNNYLTEKYPNLKITGLYSPPFFKNTEVYDHRVVNIINNSSPSIVFVVLGCPKQEKWMANMKNKINTVMIGIGGALPVMLGIQKRAPIWMQDNGLEWLYRLYQEPKRLFRRYARTNTLFLWIVIKEYLRIKFFKDSHQLE